MSKRARSVANPELGQREYRDILVDQLSEHIVEAILHTKLAKDCTNTNIEYSFSEGGLQTLSKEGSYVNVCV